MRLLQMVKRKGQRAADEKTDGEAAQAVFPDVQALAVSWHRSTACRNRSTTSQERPWVARLKKPEAAAKRRDHRPVTTGGFLSKDQICLPAPP